MKNILLIICLSSQLIFAQTTNELGLPTIANFLPSDFNGTKGIFDISQNENGLMYFVNHNAILEYDGIKWRNYKIPNQGYTHLFALGDNSRIYIGTNNDLGFFEPNKVGTLEFISLKKNLPDHLQDFINATVIAYFNGKVYFEIFPSTGSVIFYVWDTDVETMEQFEIEGKRFQIFPLNEAIYIDMQDVGLGKLVNDQFSLIKNGELLKNKSITAINSFPEEPEKLLITTVNNGFFIYNFENNTVNKWQINYKVQDEFFINTLMLPDNNILTGTLNSGALVFNLKGDLIYTFNKANGLLNNTIYSSFLDNSGGIWLGGSLGISYIDFNAPIKWLDNRSKLKGDDFYITKHRNSLYISNYSGNIFKLSPGTNQFENISVPGVIIGELFKTKDDLFYHADNELGLLVERDGEFKSIIKTPTRYYSTAKIFDLIASSYHPGRYFIGTYRGLKVIRKENDQWIDEGLIGDDRTQIYKLVEEQDGSLWALTYTHLSRIRFTKDKNGGLNLKDYKIEVFDESHGFKKGDEPKPLSFNGETVFVTSESIWQFDEKSQQFSRDSTSALSKHFEEFQKSENDTKILSQDFQGIFWLYTLAHRSLSMGIPDKEGNIEWIAEPFSRIAGLGASNPYRDDNDIVWLSTFKGLLQFDLKKALTPKPNYPALMRKVSAGEDTVIFYGGVPVFKLKAPLPYSYNKLRLEFSASSYSESKHLLFSTFLQGSDKNWTNYSSETFKEFTNLSPGNYTFWVKAINTDGKESTSASFTFEILPPWWFTWWAYLIYVFVFLISLFAFSQWREKKLRIEKENLESLVNVRTNELKESLDHLQSTQTQLIQAEKMASLGELTAGIAHEIQNPLNFVNNFSEVSIELIEELKEELKQVKTQYIASNIESQQTDLSNIDEAESILKDLESNQQKINHHGKRADSIVKGMLEHSRTSSGEKVETDINALCDEYLRLSYHGLRAKDKSFNAAFETNFEADLPKVNVISQDIGRVLLNLINNAFYAVKTRDLASPPQPDYKPTVIVSTRNLGDRIEISVKDNGNGIPDHIKDKIFQPFFTTKPTGQGTGLGLSLSYDIVKAHGGSISVESQKDEGTTFIINL
jgi:signal transduction histidine kinase